MVYFKSKNRTTMSELIKIETDAAPKALGPYSQAVAAGDFIFCSGQIAIDPKSSEVVVGGIKEQTKQVLENLGAVLIAAGSSLDNVVKTEVFLKDMNDFAAMNKVYAEYFTSAIQPARATVEVARLPKDLLVEISCIAYRKK